VVFFQVALAGWDRISAVLEMSSDLSVMPKAEEKQHEGILAFHDVTFGYEGKDVLKKARFILEKGKTLCVGRTDRRRQNNNSFIDGASL